MSETINKNILYEKIHSLNRQKDQIDKELRQIQKELNKISIFENEQYVGKCFKEVSEDDFDFKTIYYYKLLDNDKDNPYCFWTLILEDHIEDKNGNLPTPKQLAFLIGRAMAGKSPNQASLKNPQGGTTGTHDLANTLEEVNKIYLEKIEEAILEDVNDDVISIILGIRSFK